MVEGGSVSPSFVLVHARWWGIHSITYAMIVHDHIIICLDQGAQNQQTRILNTLTS
jgi:hypothetical protein